MKTVMKTVLVADDSPFIRLRVKNILSQMQPAPTVVEAESGAAAMSQFQTTKPDLVLLDIIMPGGDAEGVDVLRKMKELAPRTPVVMMTAVGFDAMVKRCEGLGAEGYLVKPFDEKEILDEVKKYL